MTKDFNAVELGQLSWADGDRAECLRQVYARVIADARSAIEWYQDNKRPKKWLATGIRWTAVLLITASGLIPLGVEVLPDIFPSLPDSSEFNALWISLVVALAAAVFGIDKFFNFSSGWMRYVRTDLALRSALGEFEFDWQVARASCSAPEPTPEQTAAMFARCKAFAAAITAIVTEETNASISEFQASLAHLGETVKPAEARVEEPVAQTGALNVSVTRGGVTWPGAIRLRVGGDAEQVCVGPNVALVGLPVGPNRIAAELEVDGTPHWGEISVDVVPGKTSPASVEVAPAA